MDNYAALKSTVIDYLERSDLDAQVGDFIRLAESRHRRDIRIREALTTQTATLAADATTVSLPADFVGLKELRVLSPHTSGGRKYLDRIESTSSAEVTAESTNDTCPPSLYAIEGDIRFSSPADQDYTTELLYYTPFETLSDTVETNALLTRAPDVYLYAALAASAPFLMHDERIPVWETLYQTARDELNLSERMNRHIGPIATRTRNS